METIAKTKKGVSGIGAAWDEAANIAAEILEQSRASLMLALRFMDVALWRMPFVPALLDLPLGANGRIVSFDPLKIINEYRLSPNETVRTYLHCILHCVFCHPFDDRHPSRRAWDIACDVAVEACILEICGLRYPSARDKERKRMLEKIREDCPQITAQRIYRMIVADPEEGTPSLSENTAKQLQDLFTRDDHSIWLRGLERPAAHLAVDNSASLRDGAENQKLKGDGPEEEPDDETDGIPGADAPGAPAPSQGGPAVEGEVEGGDRLTFASGEQPSEAEFLSMADVNMDDFADLTWKDISQQMQMDLEGFVGKMGATSGTFEINLSIASRKQYDYREFLQRFASLSEEMKVSTEEFDYIFYTYGLTRYGNMPLIEPLEYQESKRIRDFVIAIDTSASCAGSLVQRFAEKTYDVLKSSEGFGRKVNIHVIQCDSDIRKDTKITSIRDLDQGFKEFNLRGFGGTDFRPVFAYVDDLIESRELTDLKGLIYFTDGLGKFPVEPPDYETVFIFFDDIPRDREVPGWAMKVIMDEDNIREL